MTRLANSEAHLHLLSLQVLFQSVLDSMLTLTAQAFLLLNEVTPLIHHFLELFLLLYAPIHMYIGLLCAEFAAFTAALSKHDNFVVLAAALGRLHAEILLKQNRLVQVLMLRLLQQYVRVAKLEKTGLVEIALLLLSCLDRWLFAQIVIFLSDFL